MKYIDLLMSILKVYGCDFDGHMVLKPGTDVPVKIKVLDDGTSKEKILVLPTQLLLKENDWSELVGFHPACESIISGQSEVLNFLIRYTKAFMIERSMVMARELFRLTASKTKTKGTFAKYLSKIDGVDAKCASDFRRLEETLGKSGGVRASDLVKITMARRDYLDGTQYQRICKFSSPLHEENDDDVVLFGCRISSKSRKMGIVNLLNDLLLGGEAQFGSNGDAPYFESLMELLVEFSKKYNAVLSTMADDTELKEIDLSWVSALEKLPMYRSTVTPLEGNIGISTIDSDKDGKLAKQPLNFNADSLRKEAEVDKRAQTEQSNGKVSLLDMGRSDDRQRYDYNETSTNPRDAGERMRRDYNDHRDDRRNGYYGHREYREDRRDYRDDRRDYRNDRRDYRDERRDDRMSVRNETHTTLTPLR